MDAASFRIAFMNQAGVANASIGPAAGAVKNLLALLSIVLVFSHSGIMSPPDSCPSDSEPSSLSVPFLAIESAARGWRSHLSRGWVGVFGFIGVRGVRAMSINIGGGVPSGNGADT